MEAGRNSSSVLGALKKAFITIGMVLFVIVAFRNSLVWYVAKVWSSSHDFWSYLWAAVFRASGESDFVMAVVCERLQQNQLMITHRSTTDVARVTCTSPLLPPPPPPTVSWLLIIGTYIVCNAPFVIVDLTGRPAWLKKYKIQDDMNEPVRDTVHSERCKSAKLRHRS